MSCYRGVLPDVPLLPDVPVLPAPLLPGVVLPPDEVPVEEPGLVVPVDPVPEVPVDVPLETPVAGGVVVELVPGVGGQGIAVPLVPTVPGVDAVPVAPVVPVVPVDRAVVLPPCAAAAADGEPLCDSGPASVALLVVLLVAVGVPVELFTWLCGSLAAAVPFCAGPDREPGVCVDAVVPAAPVEPGAVPVAPVVLPTVPAPVTGTHGVVDVGLVGAPGVEVPVPGCVPGVAVVPEVPG